MATTVSRTEWFDAAKARYGGDAMGWRFKCPSCGHIATVKDWNDAGAPEGAIAFSCVGRWTTSKQEMGTKDGGPCNYAGGGLFRLNPIIVRDEEGKEHQVFDFAERPLASQP